MKIQQNFANVAKFHLTLQNIAKIQNFQLDNLVDFEKCCKCVFACKDRRRYSRKRAKCCRKFAKNWQLPYGSRLRVGKGRARGARRAATEGPADRAGFLQNFVNFWRARSRLYQIEILQ